MKPQWPARLAAVAAPQIAAVEKRVSLIESDTVPRIPNLEKRVQRVGDRVESVKDRVTGIAQDVQKVGDLVGDVRKHVDKVSNTAFTKIDKSNQRLLIVEKVVHIEPVRIEKLIDVDGIGPKLVKQLEVLGITTPQQLIAGTASPAGLERIAAELKPVSAAQIQGWLEQL